MTTMPDNTVHRLRSAHREALLEHLSMKFLWRRGEWRLEVLKPQVDSGYDLVLEANGVVRQLKSSFRGSTIGKVNINILLADKLSGSVIFMRIDPDTLELGLSASSAVRRAEAA
jgi:hypothetical protein